MQTKSLLKKSLFSKILEHSEASATARTCADLIGVNRNTVSKYFRYFREIFAQNVEDDSTVGGEIEVDKSYFGGRRKGKRSRGAAGKVPVLGLLKEKEKYIHK